MDEIRLLNFLRSVFGKDLAFAPCDYPKETPYYIRDGYQLLRLSRKRYSCVLLYPKAPSVKLPALKKQFRNFQRICGEPCALCLENMTSARRRDLIENDIPLVSLSQQVYLPFWGCLFNERFKADVSVGEKMAPGTQLVFLYLYYGKETDGVNLTRLSRDLGVSKATCTRAVRDLTADGLLTLEAEGTNKWLVPACEKSEFLKKGYGRLRSPVERLIYVKQMPGHIQPSVRMQPLDHMQSLDHIPHFLSGLEALSAASLICPEPGDARIAISQKSLGGIPSEEMITRQEYEDFGGTALEVWSYDPALFSEDGRVDDISLLLSLEKDPDERVQMGLDILRKRHGLSMEDETLSLAGDGISPVEDEITIGRG